MSYSQKYYEEIFESMIEDSVEKGLISHSKDFLSFIKNKEDISNYYVMDKSVIAEMFEKVYEDLTEVYNSWNVQLATGVDLDHIGAIVGCPRPEASHASVEVTFTLSDIVDTDIRLDEGILLSTADGIEYITVEELYLATDESSTTVQCMSVESGTDVKINSNELVNIISSLHYNFTIINNNSSSGGDNEYSDKDYRELLMGWSLSKIKGSLEAYDNFFANFDGIDDYKLVPNWDGTGTMKVILDPGTPYLLNEAYERLQNEITQATEDIVMFAPSEKLIDIEAVVDVDIDLINPYSIVEKQDIQSRIIQAITVFIDGGYRQGDDLELEYYSGLSIGEDFIPHKLAVFLDEEIPELKNIVFNYPADYISILDDEQGKSNMINIEMI